MIHFLCCSRSFSLQFFFRTCCQFAAIVVYVAFVWFTLLQSCCTANITTKPNYLFLLLSLYSCVVLCVFEKCTLKSFLSIYSDVFFCVCIFHSVSFLPCYHSFWYNTFRFSICASILHSVCVCVRCLYRWTICMFVNTFALLFISFNSFCIWFYFLFHTCHFLSHFCWRHVWYV